MSLKIKQLSNPFSTGNGGGHFEAHIQAYFVTLMLSGGYVPCMRCWPIVEIKMQGKVEGYETDDLIVYIEGNDKKERHKLLCQAKRSIALTKGSAVFGEVLQAAWNDFANPKKFLKGKDALALITGPLSHVDSHTMQWLLSQARHSKDANQYFRDVDRAKFSPPKATEKLQAIKYHLKAANGGSEVSKKDLYTFLKHFNLLAYDLGNESGVVLSLLHSHISQFNRQSPDWVWSRIVDVVQTWNQDAGTVTLDNLPDDIKEVFKQRAIHEIPGELTAQLKEAKTDWSTHSDATYLALANLIGAWDEASESDIDVLSTLLGLTYEAWIQKAREILQYPDSPLSLKDGIWVINDRVGLWHSLGSRILDRNLDAFRTLALQVLGEVNPSFELPVEERYAANLRGKVLSHSYILRKGIAEGLAILGSNSQACSNCSMGKAAATPILMIREVFDNANWELWGSLNDLLPMLSESAPDEFLTSVEHALQLSPCPFDELFAQERSGIIGRNYLTGLLGGLEGLAWDENYFVRVCVVLGELASHDPGGNWGNRPFNSLVTILLPWIPQTLASVEKRQVAVETLCREFPDIAWGLIVQLLPTTHQSSSGSHKPTWRIEIPENMGKSISSQEYWQQVSFYAEQAVRIAGNDISKLPELTDHFDKLPRVAFDQLIEILSSSRIVGLQEEQRLLIWNALVKFTNRHKSFPDAEWAMPHEILRNLDNVIEMLAPSNPMNLYRPLFSDLDREIYGEVGSWEQRHENVKNKRETAISEIFRLGGMDSVMQFADTCVLPEEIGKALGAMGLPIIEQAILPDFLNSGNKTRLSLANAFVWKRHQDEGWGWCDGIDKSMWNSRQIGCFLTCLPFTMDTWARGVQWLGKNDEEYWSHVHVNAYQADSHLDTAIDKLLEYGRPHAAIGCLDRMRDHGQPNVEKCVRALLAAIVSGEPNRVMDKHHIVELIKYLQFHPSVAHDDLLKVEWAYLPLLNVNSGVSPKFLESKLASDPEFYCEVIRLIYRSKKEDAQQEDISKLSQVMINNGGRLLREWFTTPGTQTDGSFDAVRFNEWLQAVKSICTESDHLEVALDRIGRVLVYSPKDPGGLWIHKAIAEVLNARDSGDIRNGYQTGVYYSRGVHLVDPSGKPEMELAESFRRKAEQVENVGFQRFAITLKNIAKSYDMDAKRIISEHNGDQSQ